MIKDKQSPSTKTRVMTATSIFGFKYTGDVTLPGYRDRIEYDAGPMYRNGRLVWKSCTHETELHSTGTTGMAMITVPEDTIRWININGIIPPNEVRVPALPSATYDRQVLNDVVSQVDLNCRDTVLYYSGVLQAIPLVGGVLRFNRIMKDLGRSLSRGLRKQPFRTVIKSAISLDFIDRFVVKPTIDDARKFNDAVNYIFRVYQTAHERNVAPFALQAKRTNVIKESTSSGTKSYYGNNGVRYSATTRVAVESKAFLYLSANYNTAAIDPIHLWATRSGITRPLESVWDLIPFSFVVDYFTRAGDWIQRLGEEVDRQGALEGVVTKVHACWGSLSAKSSVTLTGTGAYGDSRWGGRVDSYTPSSQTIERSYYRRFPIGNPWLELTQLEDDNLFLDVNLTKTRQRTLAQLLIQAKL
jgi:hypothetical protein